jgi:DNA invertase Pin-like site-specific DNA recombinase
MDTVFAVIYGAKSTDDRKGSIPDQLRQAREMADREGWVIPAGAEYEAEGFSAYSGNRGPGLKAALARAAELAEERGEVVMLIVQHNDRISRGAGDEPDAPRAFVEIWHELRRLNVHLRSVQDDDDLRDSASVASKGKRNHDDSKRKSATTKDGIRREVERGVWRGGTTPDGYGVEFELDERGRQQLNEWGHPIRRLVKDLARAVIYDLIWSLASEGKSALTISLELGRRGYLTQPVRRNRGPSPGRRARGGPKSFSADSVAQILQSPVYAGQQVYQGKTYPGDWDTYVDIEVFERLKRERARHSSATKRAQHRLPPVAYLLQGLARCGLCGATAFARTGKPRKDGTRRRQYVCESHRQHHPHSDEWCRALPGTRPRSIARSSPGSRGSSATPRLCASNSKRASVRSERSSRRSPSARKRTQPGRRRLL